MARENSLSMRGQAMIEYIVILLVSVVILVVAVGGKDSVMYQLGTAVKSFWQNYSYIISLP